MSVVDRVNALSRKVPSWAVYTVGALPALWLLWLALSNGLGADPVKAIERGLGERGLQFLIASLCITPLRWLGVNLIKHRRAIGLIAFFYIVLHLVAWVWLDMGLRWSEVVADLYKRQYIIVGMIGLLAMLPLAVTSSNRAIRAMGPQAWGRLHRLAYVAGIAGAVHYLMLVKVWSLQPLTYAGIVAALLLARVLRSLSRRGLFGAKAA
ncbi:MAG: protein-methionine-sulfoxide reductase heme-binding subunit MsrQ [Pseudomonadota bacterium]